MAPVVPPDVAKHDGSPPLSLGIRGDEWEIVTRKPSWDNEQDEDTDPTPVGTWIADRWTDWVFHIIWRPDGTGLTEVWKDGDPTPVFSRRHHQNKFDDGMGCYMKFGVYKWDWEKGPTATAHRLIFYDELRIADDTGDRSTVSPPS